MYVLVGYSTESLIHTHRDTTIMQVQKVGEMHILRYQMLDIKHWQSTLGTKSFAGQHLWSSVILSYCCVSIHKHLQTKKKLFLESLTTAVPKRD